VRLGGQLPARRHGVKYDPDRVSCGSRAASVRRHAPVDRARTCRAGRRRYRQAAARAGIKKENTFIGLHKQVIYR
jgi:hypothetical protein